MKELRWGIIKNGNNKNIKGLTRGLEVRKREGIFKDLIFRLKQLCDNFRKVYEVVLTYFRSKEVSYIFWEIIVWMESLETRTVMKDQKVGST